MPEDNDVRDVSTRGGTIGENSFDQLAKGLASGTITRGQALKLAGAAVLGTVLGSLFPRWAFTQDECDDDEVLCGGDCCDPEDCCGSTCCDVTEECCDGVCCGATEECCYGTCCEIRKTCGAGGWCVCSEQYIPCGSDCCDPVLETCVGGECRNLFCESCWAEGRTCCQSVHNGVLVGQDCCGSGQVCRSGVCL